MKAQTAGINNFRKALILIFGFGLLIPIGIIIDAGKPWHFVSITPYQGRPSLKTPGKYIADPHTVVAITRHGWFDLSAELLGHYEFDYHLSREELNKKADSIIKER